PRELRRARPPGPLRRRRRGNRRRGARRSGPIRAGAARGRAGGRGPARRGDLSGRNKDVLLSRTIELAERGRYTVSPNPMVGAVVARGHRVLAEAWHRR